jgi:Kef-type K+ transport system membrane component KefB
VVAWVLAPLFFATAGLRMDLTALAHLPTLAAGIVLLLVAIAGKFGGASIGARMSRLDRWETIALGAGLNARGVIEVIIALVGLRLGILSVDTYTIIVLVAIVASVMAPPVLHLAMRQVPVKPEELARAAARQPAKAGGYGGGR